MAINAGEIFVRFRADSTLAVREFAKFQGKLNTTINNTRDKVKSLNQSLSGIGLLAGVGLGAAILKIGSDFDKAITNVRAITKETSEQFQATRGKAIEIASEYGKAADEVGGALFQIVSAGKRGEDAILALVAATKLGRAGLVDTALATDVLIGSLNAFKIEGSRAEDIAGKLIGTVDRGILTFDDLATKLGQVSPIASAAGLEIEELLGIIALLTRNGVQAAQAITQARGAIVKLVAPGKQGREEIEKLLGTTIEATVATKGYIGTLEAVVAASDGSIATFKKLFEDVEAVQGITAIASAGFDQLRGDIEGLQSAGAGTLNQTLAIQAGSFASLTSELRNLVQNRVVAFFDDNREAIVATTNAIIAFVRNNRLLIDSIVVSTAIVAGLSVAGLALKLALTGLSFLLGGASVAVNILSAAKDRDTASTVANTSQVAANNASTLVSTGNIYSNNMARNFSSVSINAQTAAVLNQNRILAGNVAAQAAAVATGRRVATNTAATTVAVSAAAASTGVLARAWQFLNTSIKLPVLSRIPLVMKGAGIALVGAAKGAAIFAAGLSAVAIVAVAAYKAGQLISDAATGNSKAYREELKDLRRLNSERNLASIRNITGINFETAANAKSAASAEKYRDTLLALADAQNEAAAGSAEATKRVIDLEIALSELEGTGASAFENATAELKRYEQVVLSALKETGKLSDSYLGAFTESGRLIQGFGQSLAEADSLGEILGETEATNLVTRIKAAKDAINGITQAQIQLEESSRRAATSSALLAGAIGAARSVSDEYAGSIQSLSQKANDLVTGEFEKSFNDISKDLAANEAIITQLVKAYDDLATSAQQLRANNASPEEIAALNETFSVLAQQIDQAAASSVILAAALGNLIAEQNEEILAKRIEAIDESTQAEIRALQEVGKVREAEELAAQLRRDQSTRRILAAMQEESDRRDELSRKESELFEEQKVRAEEIRKIRQSGGDASEQENAFDRVEQEREMLQLTIERSIELTELYENQIDGVTESYGRELEAIKRNGAEQERRLADEQQRRAIIALELEKSDLSRIALQAILSGNLDEELKARQRIAEIELEILGTKGLQAEKELESIAAIEERLELLREEIESSNRIGGGAREAGDAAQDAQRDIGGASSVEGARENIRRTLDEDQTDKGVKERQDAFEETLDLERRARLQQLAEAQQRGDEEEQKRIEERIVQIDELRRIFQTEVDRRIQEIKDETEARRKIKEAQDAQDALTQQQPAPADPAQPVGPGTEGPATESRPEPGKPAQAGTEPAGRAAAQQANALKEQSETVIAEIRNASNVLAESTEGVRNALTSLGNTVVSTMSTITGKMAEIAKQTNENSRAIRAIQIEAQALQIEGRS